MNVTDNIKLKISSNNGKIKLIRTDGQIRYYKVSDIKVEEGWDNDLLILPNGWKCVIDEDYSVDSFITEMNTTWKKIIIEDNIELCVDQSGFCEYKTDEGNGYRCNGCIYRHPRFAVIQNDIPNEEILLGLDILKSDSEYKGVAKLNSTELAELYKQCSTRVTSDTNSGTMGDIRCEGIYLSIQEFMLLYEKIHGMFSLFDLYIDSKHYKLREQDVSLRDGNVLWGNILEISVYGYDFNSMSFVCLDCLKFPIIEKAITKSQLIKLSHEKSIYELKLISKGLEWEPNVKYKLK